MALRDILALFEIKIEGAEKVDQVNDQLAAATALAQKAELAYKNLAQMFGLNADQAAALQDKLGDSATTIGVVEEQLTEAAQVAQRARDAFQNLVTTFGLSGDQAAILQAQLAGLRLPDLGNDNENSLLRLKTAAAKVAKQFGVTEEQAEQLITSARGVATASKVAEKGGLKVLEKGLKGVTTQTKEAKKELTFFQKLTAKLKPDLVSVAAGVAAAFGAHAVVGAVQETLAAANAVKLLSNQTGLATDAVQVYQEFLKRAGVTGDGLVDVTGNLAERLGDAVNGSKEAAATFKALGVETTDVNGQMRDMDQVLPNVLEALADLRTPTERMAWASKIWGDTSAVLTSNLGENSDALREQLKMLERTAVVFSDDFVNSAKETSDEISLMSRQLQGVKASLLAELLPALRWVIDKITAFGLGLRSLLKETKFLKHAFAFLTGGALIKGISMMLTKFGGVHGILSKLRPLLGILARFALKFLLPFFLLDEIITFLEGGDSLLGRWLDKLGPGTAEFVRGFFTTIWDAITTTVASVVALFQAIFTGSDEAWSHFLAVSQPIAALVDNIAKWFSDLWAAIGADFSRLWGGIGGKIAKVAGFFGIDVGGGSTPGQLPAGAQQAAESAGRANTTNPYVEDHRSVSVQVNTTDPYGVASAVSRGVDRALTADRNAVVKATSRD